MENPLDQELWCWGSNAFGQVGNLRPRVKTSSPSAILSFSAEAGGNKNGAVCPAARLRLPKGTRVEARKGLEAEWGEMIF